VSEARKNRKMIQKAVGKAQKLANRVRYKCMVPDCNDDAIKSHSQQKEMQLRSISQSGEVYALHRNRYQLLKHVNPEKILTLRRTGLGKASAFPGFCKKHDDSIFSPIESGRLEKNNVTQVALFLLRSLGYEYAQKRTSLIYHDALLNIGGRYFQPEMVETLKYMMFGINLYLKQDAPYYFDRVFGALESNDFSEVNFNWKLINSNVNASCCCVFSPVKDLDARYEMQGTGNLQPLMSFNLVPSEHETHVITAWLTEHDAYTGWIEGETSEIDDFEMYINRCAITESEDTCFSPALWEGLSDEKKRETLNAMRHELWRGDLDEIPIIIEIPK
jgi:hypothetical protein